MVTLNFCKASWCVSPAIDSPLSSRISSPVGRGRNCSWGEFCPIRRRYPLNSSAPTPAQVSVRCTKHHKEHLLIQGSPPGRWARQQCWAFSGTAYFPGWDPGSLARHTRPGPIGSLPTSGLHLFPSCLSAPHAIRSPGPFPDATHLPFPQWSVQFHACFHASFLTKMYISYLLHLPLLNLLVSADFALSWLPEPTTLRALVTPVVIDELWKSLPGDGALLHQRL